MVSKLEVKLKKGNNIGQTLLCYMYVIANTINFYYILSLTKIIPTVLRILAGH